MTLTAAESAATRNTAPVPLRGADRGKIIAECAAVCERAGVNVGPRRLHHIVRRWETSGQSLGAFLARELRVEHLPAARVLRGFDPTATAALRNIARGERV